MSTPIDRYLAIDEEGYFIFDGRRVDDKELGFQLIANLTRVDKDRYFTSLEGGQAWVEAFDEPLVARHIQSKPGDKVRGLLDLPYGQQVQFLFANLTVDEWDRFHGVTDKQIPFVLSRTAQVEFFDMLEEFSDDSVTIHGQRYEVPPWLGSSSAVNNGKFWDNIYETEAIPGWELGRESNILTAVVPSLKLNKSRVLVLGCGTGHDAAYFAHQGHLVTAVDFSEQAIERARTAYSELKNLQLVQADVFNLPKEWTGSFDLVFDHMCYCAISPERRNELVGTWRRLLTAQGNLLSVFRANSRSDGPPFGGTEWEVRQRLQSNFSFLLWNRWRQSIEPRKGKELLVYAQKK